MSQIIETDGQCVVCHGKIVEVREQEFDPSFGPRIFGPGGKRQYREVSRGFHCQDCGIRYAFVPKE